jgi:hypothetical protein
MSMRRQSKSGDRVIEIVQALGEYGSPRRGRQITILRCKRAKEKTQGPSTALLLAFARSRSARYDRVWVQLRLSSGLCSGRQSFSKCQAGDDVGEGGGREGTQEIYGVIAEDAAALESRAEKAVHQHAQERG